MFKNSLIFLAAMLFSAAVFAAGPAQIWRLDVTGTNFQYGSGSQQDVAEIAEFTLYDETDTNVIDLFRNFNYVEDTPAGADTWNISHNLGIQSKFSDVSVIAYAVDVVAPGDWYVNTNTGILSVRSHIAWNTVEYETTDTPPGSPEVDDVYYGPTADEYYQWDGASWNLLTVTETTAALPLPDAVEPTSIVLAPGGGIPSTGGPAANNDVTVSFPVNTAGAATVIGASFDLPSVNRKGEAIPPSELVPNRAAVVMFDGNAGSKFKSQRVPTQRNPLTIQYTFWVGDPSRYPVVRSYSITSPDTDTAPREWTLNYWTGAEGWVKVDQQAGIRFGNGETKTFEID